jgi:hypothetical protein
VKPIEVRLQRLERARGAGWEAFLHIPPQQWPDAALWAFLGLPEGTSDAELQRIIAEASEAKDRQP